LTQNSSEMITSLDRTPVTGSSKGGIFSQSCNKRIQYYNLCILGRNRIHVHLRSQLRMPSEK
jgi:hypothetical protein